MTFAVATFPLYIVFLMHIGLADDGSLASICLKQILVHNFESNVCALSINTSTPFMVHTLTLLGNLAIIWDRAVLPFLCLIIHHNQQKKLGLIFKEEKIEDQESDIALLIIQIEATCDRFLIVQNYSNMKHALPTTNGASIAAVNSKCHLGDKPNNSSL